MLVQQKHLSFEEDLIVDNITIGSNKLARALYKPYLRLRQPRCNKHICFLTGGAEGVRAVIAEVEVSEERGGTGVVFLHHCRPCEAGLFVSQLAKTTAGKCKHLYPMLSRIRKIMLRDHRAVMQQDERAQVNRKPAARLVRADQLLQLDENFRAQRDLDVPRQDQLDLVPHHRGDGDAAGRRVRGVEDVSGHAEPLGADDVGRFGVEADSDPEAENHLEEFALGVGLRS